MVTKVVKDF